jgi:hypothetical protein
MRSSTTPNGRSRSLVRTLSRDGARMELCWTSMNRSSWTTMISKSKHSASFAGSSVLHTDNLCVQRIAIQRVYAAYVPTTATNRTCAGACRTGYCRADQDFRAVARATFTISIPGARAFYYCAHRRCAEGNAPTLTSRNPGASTSACATTGSRTGAVTTAAGRCAEAATCAIATITTSGYTHSHIRSSDEWPCTGSRLPCAVAGTVQAGSRRVSDNSINAVSAALVAASSFFAIAIAIAFGRAESGRSCCPCCQNRWCTCC